VLRIPQLLLNVQRGGRRQRLGQRAGDELQGQATSDVLSLTDTATNPRQCRHA
jgi:hypothetical protein